MASHHYELGCAEWGCCSYHLCSYIGCKWRTSLHDQESHWNVLPPRLVVYPWLLSWESWCGVGVKVDGWLKWKELKINDYEKVKVELWRDGDWDFHGIHDKFFLSLSVTYRYTAACYAWWWWDSGWWRYLTNTLHRCQSWCWCWCWRWHGDRQ